ncbi:beta-N-acetylhexosaminidase, partial [Flavobacterium sp.]
MNRFLILSLVFISKLVSAQNPLPLIPQPQQIEIHKGTFTLNKETVIQPNYNLAEAQYLQKSIKELTGLDLKIQSAVNKQNRIVLAHSEIKRKSNDGYELLISNKKFVAIYAKTPEGFFYGIQTFLQLLPIEKKDKISLPCLSILDYSKFQWRGMHLDVSRHFFPKDFIKKYIDYLAMYKMNTFHWHLTDDQGWRIEIKKYPKLTEVGAWRNGSMIGHYTDQTFDDIRYGGFYTQEEIKEIVAYAKERHITIVPEIEMPG